VPKKFTIEEWLAIYMLAAARFMVPKAFKKSAPEQHEPEIIRRPPPVMPSEDQDQKFRECAWRESKEAFGDCARCGGEWEDYVRPRECVVPTQ
jgi:hypothetical protein